MLLIRDLMFCEPGKVRPMVEKFKAMKKLAEGKGMGRMRILTDVSAEGGADTKEMEKIMADYQDLVVCGRREIYTVEG